MPKLEQHIAIAAIPVVVHQNLERIGLGLASIVDFTAVTILTIAADYPIDLAIIVVAAAIVTDIVVGSVHCHSNLDQSLVG